MYVNPFWVGVATTIIVEVVILVVAVAISMHNDNKKKTEESKMANMIEKFKENKKVMMIKMDQASKMADEAAEEFISTLKPLVESASEEDLKAFLQADDELIESEDKLAIIAAYAETHDDVGGIAIIGIRK